MNENKEFASDIKVGHKEIEEIAKLIDDRLIEARNWLGSMNRGEGYWIATALHNAGYRNVKDKVVLSKEEYENFLKVNSELAVAQKSISFLTNELNDYKQRYESAEKRYEQLIQSSCEALEKGKEQVRKEMATEIYKLSEEWLGGIAFWNKVRKLCKECGAEVE